MMDFDFDLLTLLWIVLCMTLVSTEAIRRFLIYKAKRDERKRKRKKAVVDRERASLK